MTKRIISMLLAIVMMVGMLPTAAFAAEAAEETLEESLVEVTEEGLAEPSEESIEPSEEPEEPSEEPVEPSEEESVEPSEEEIPEPSEEAVEGTDMEPQAETPSEPAVLEGLTITVDGKTYGSSETAIITTQTQSIVYTVSGRNFAGLNAEYMVQYVSAYSTSVANGYGWDIDTVNNTATKDFISDLSLYKTNCTTPREVLFWNNDGLDWVGTGVSVQYIDTTSAVLESVTVTVDGETYGSGETAIVNSETKSLVYTVSGYNFAALTDDNRIYYCPRCSEMVTEGFNWTIDPVENTAAKDLVDDLDTFANRDTAFDVQLSNDGGSSWFDTGVDIRYVEAGSVSTKLQLKAVNANGEVITDTLDVYLDAGSGMWIDNNSPYSVVLVPDTAYTLSDWDYCPDGYLLPEYDITFTVDADGKVTVTGGEATVETVNGINYFVVTLEALGGLRPEGAYPVSVGGTYITEDNMDDVLGDADPGAAVTFDPNTNTLTLNNAITGGIYSEVPLTVELEGRNTVVSEYDGFCFRDPYGESEYEINFTGNGSLELISGENGIYGGSDYGMYVSIGGNLTVYSNSGGEGIYLECADEACLTIEEGASLTFEIVNNEAIYLDSDYVELEIRDDAKVVAGTEENKLGEEAIFIYAYYEGYVTIRDNANVQLATSDEEGIYVYGDDEEVISIKGNPTVNILADEEALDADTVTISGGTVNAIGGDGYEGIYASELTITGGDITVGCGEDGQGIEADYIEILGGTLKVLNGGMMAEVLDGVETILLDEGVSIVTPQNGRIGRVYLPAESRDVMGVLNADGTYADSVIISTDYHLQIAQKHVMLNPEQTHQILADISPADWEEGISFFIEPGGEDVISIEDDGTVTALSVGTAYVTVYATVKGITLSDQCRIDVAMPNRVEGIQLSTTKATTELFSTDYAEFDVLLKLPQELAPAYETVDSQIPEDMGVAIESAAFTDAAMADLFHLIPVDDRTLAVVPTEYAVAHPKEVKGSYKGTVDVTVDGVTHTSGNLTLTVKKTQPKLKASVPAFNSFYKAQSRQIAVTGATVTGMELNPGKAQPDWLTLENDCLTLTENAPRKNLSGKVYLLIYTEEWRIPAAVTLTVKNTYKEPTLKLNPTSITLNTAAITWAYADVLVSPADYDISELDYRLTDSTGKVDKTGSGELEIEYYYDSDYGYAAFDIRATEAASGTYKLFASIDGGKEAVLTIKTISAKPTVTIKKVADLDLNKYYAGELLPSFKNYNGHFEVEEITVKDSKKQDVTQLFWVDQYEEYVYVYCEDDTPVGTYTISLKLLLDDGSFVEGTAKIAVKRTPLKLKLGTGKLSLNKAVQDRVSVSVVSATKNYTVENPVWELMDKSGKNSAEGMLDILWVKDKLIISTNEDTEFGATYKLLVRANEDAPAQTLTITIPTEKKSAVSATLKATGAIDVIRDGSAITITPTYKNTKAAGLTEVLVFSKVVGKTVEEADDLFECVPNGKGGYTITKAEDAQLDHTAKYQVRLIAVIGDEAVAVTKPITLPVKMGSAKVTLTATDTILFSKDAQDRATFTLAAKDAALNDLVYVEVKDAKYQDKLEVIDYGNGQYAIGFKYGTVHESLIGKTVTVAMNVFIEGNQTLKANTTVKVKLTILK